MRRIQRLQVVQVDIVGDGREFLFAVVVIDQQISTKAESSFMFIADNQRFRGIIRDGLSGSLACIAVYTGRKQDSKENDGQSFHHGSFVFEIVRLR